MTKLTNALLVWLGLRLPVVPLRSRLWAEGARRINTWRYTPVVFDGRPY